MRTTNLLLAGVVVNLATIAVILAIIAGRLP